MTQRFRIHGDNIVECERIITLIKNNIEIINESRKLISQAVIQYVLEFKFNNNTHTWRIDLFPGFDKRNRSRWGYNIFEALKEKGSFLDETPDAIITKVHNSEETVIMAIEFSSALNAGNQAWQRSGRAYSTAKIGSPYLYLDEFVRYELDAKTRERKNLRFSNPAIPYSYINMSKEENTFIVQSYFKSEEFDRNNETLKTFPEEIFSENEIGDYIILSMLEEEVSEIENILLHKNLEMVKFLNSNNDDKKSDKKISKQEWEQIFEGKTNVVDQSKAKKLSFKKTIQSKSLTKSSKTTEFNKLVSKYAYGIASEGLPFGVIDKSRRMQFSKELSHIYNLKKEFINKISSDEVDLLICLVKGFKPRGDDNRPDRGVLPFLSMLTSEKYEILSYLYGPMTEQSISLFENDFKTLAERSGFWNVFFSMSDYIIIDAPVLKTTKKNKVAGIISQDFKNQQLHSLERSAISFSQISVTPNSVHEDDVDSTIHTLFTSLSESFCYESSCNPPGGDWSGISIMDNNNTYRWLSLPRAPQNVKRPDHILQLKDIEGKPILLIIESKDYPKDVIKEGNLDKGLKAYLQNLLEYPPSAINNHDDQKWRPNYDKNKLVDISDYSLVTAAAYIKKESSDFIKDIFKSSNCDIQFIFEPLFSIDRYYWSLTVVTNSNLGLYVFELLLNNEFTEKSDDIGIKLIK